MKKLCSILLMLSLIFYLSGYVLLYFCRLSSIKSENNMLRHFIGSEEVIVTTFAFPLFSINTREIFLYQNSELNYFGRIYDIIFSYEMNDTLFVSAVYDEKENLLNDGFARISVMQNNSASGIPLVVSINSEIMFFNPDDIFRVCYHPVYLFSIADRAEFVLETFPNKISPPPRHLTA